MADLREVFEMVKQQTEPDLDSWAEQERRIRHASRTRKAGAFALVAALIVGIAVLVMSDLGGDERGAIPAAESENVGPAPLRELSLLNIDTGATTGTGITPAGSGVDVSPDGTKIVYVDGTSAADEVVHVADVDGSNVQAFDRTKAPGGPTAPRWSADGTRVVYQGREADNKIGNLYVLDVTTERVTQITDLESLTVGFYYMAPTFSPDGDTALFTRPTGSLSSGEGGRSWDLWSVPVTGGEPTLVRQNAAGVDFAPSGDAMAYSEYSEVDGRFEFGDLYVARSNGTGARRLVEGSIVLPRWSPDGSQIGYTDIERNGLFVVDVETGETRLVLDSDEWATWVDENTMIVDLSD